MGHAALHRDARVRHLGEVDRVVLAADDGLREVFPDLLGVAHVVAAEVDVHETRDELVVRGVAVVVHALHERGGAVADADDGDADTPVLGTAVAVAIAIGGHASSLESRSRAAS